MVSLRMSSILLAVAALVAVGAGCGSSKEPDLANGKALFMGAVPKQYQKDHPKYQSCGGCHGLARADAGGGQGPNLDDAFRQSRADGMSSKTIQGVVRDQINSPRRDSIMPADIVKGDDARDVAAYVASVAGQPGKDVGQLATIGATASSKPIPAKGGVLTMPANEQGRTLFASTAATAAAGSLQIAMPNPSSLQHDIALKADEGKGPEIGKGAVVGQGGTSKFTANLKPGKYEFLCTVPGHEAGGMKGILTVK
jgi:mono/diheme cytochrome c family protein